jgi:hypothetical protein
MTLNPLDEGVTNTFESIAAMNAQNSIGLTT